MSKTLSRKNKCCKEKRHRKSCGQRRLERRIIYFCFIDYTKASDCVDHNRLWKILKEMGISDHITCLLEISVYRSRSNI